MIQLLFAVVFAEMTLILLLLFKTPLRRAVILGLDRTKRSHGPVVVKTVAGTVALVLGSSLYSVRRIYRRRALEGDANPTDQILMTTHLLEATLMGAILSLGLMIDRLHHYIRELRFRRRGMEDITKQNRALQDEKEKVIRGMEEEVSELRTKLKYLQSDLSTKTEKASVAEASVVALRKQSEGLLLEYDRLLEENQKFQKQVRVLDQRLSRSGSKKVM
uniref:Endoplasmic reticulum transmembrane protein n=1 Tax=Kalanchoe fedtschenkoi TaxID=63787 RepID=A0A7N0ZZX7_KALFE